MSEVILTPEINKVIVSNDTVTVISVGIQGPTGSSGGLSDGDYGDITLSGGGTVMTIDSGLDAAKIGGGAVSNTEFGYLDGVTSAIQTQINTKITASSSDTLTNKNLTSGTNSFPTFNQNTSGNAATATALQNARTINGTSFDGTANITVTAVPSGTQQNSVYIQTAADGTITLTAYALYACTITKMWGLATTSGTVTAAVKINGTNVTGLSALSVTSTPQNVSATAANTVAIGDAITLVLSSSASPVGLKFTLETTR